ncbi:aspartate aminotransferase family protein [Pikeienuella sp. HZG-20]|uniref:aspartate aminotransferase family protein n=1 Tax=Paludibacillus litoralis TaxID=3133267 RepID=UPI0030EF3365
MSDSTTNVSLESALQEAQETFTSRNPKSETAYVKATKSMPGGNTRTSLFYTPFPLAMVRGEGPHLWDADGHEYTDFLGEYTAGIFGHSHPVIRAAIDRTLDAGINYGGHGLLEAEFAATLCERFPALDLVRFTNSGTEANLMAISTALAVNKRKKVMVFNGGYHGGVFTFHHGHNIINAPFDFVIARYNDVHATRQLIEDNASALGVVILEPMQGGGGCIPATREFLEMLRETTKAHGVTLIFDEVMTSRLGPGGLQGEHGVTPDLTTLGKYIGGGMSFGAFGGAASIMSHLDPRQPHAISHAGTFNNNVLTMAAGMAAMTEIYTRDAVKALNEFGEDTRDKLNMLARKHGVEMSFTGLGSMMNVHMTTDRIHNVEDAARGDARARDLFFFDMLERGIYLARRGMINLSLVHEQRHVDSLLAAVEDFITIRRPLLSGKAR